MTKCAYLTIDDSPSKNMRQKIDFLHSQKIPAIFFCVGQEINKYPNLILYAAKKGFYIGNHSYTHPYFSNLTLAQCYKEISKTDEIIAQLFNKANIKLRYKLFRFPHGDKGGNKNGRDYEKELSYNQVGLIKKAKIQNYLRKLGYKQPKFRNINYKYFIQAGFLNDIDCNWTYDCLEYSIKSKRHIFGINSLKKVFARMDENEPEKCRGLNYSSSNDIILIHDHHNTTKYFKPIINKLLSKGIKFIDIPML